MEGLSPSDWAWISFGASMIAIGVHEIVMAPRFEVLYDHSRINQLGGRDGWSIGPRLNGLMAIGLGVVTFLNHPEIDPFTMRLMGAAFVMLGAGLLALDRFYGWRRRWRERKLAERIARGEDAYFEELRSLESDWSATVSKVPKTFNGVLAILCGVSNIVVSFTI